MWFLGTLLAAVAVFIAYVFIQAIYHSILNEGYRTGRKEERTEWRIEAIRRGYAEYNPKTGVWSWKN